MSTSVRRCQVAYVRSRGLSIGHACALVQVALSTGRHVSRLAVQDAPVIARMRGLAAQYPRYGYRRIRSFLGREGLTMSADRMYRLWRQAGLQVPQKWPRRLVAASRPRPTAPEGVHHVWAYDCVFDASRMGRRSSA